MKIISHSVCAFEGRQNANSSTRSRVYCKWKLVLKLSAIWPEIITSPKVFAALGFVPSETELTLKHLFRKRIVVSVERTLLSGVHDIVTMKTSVEHK